VLREAILNNVRRFDAFRLRLGVARMRLRSRLAHLVASGLMERRRLDGARRSYEYLLTELRVCKPRGVGASLNRQFNNGNSGLTVAR
jgi:DNA-binding HxlR family transcriptional regulator